MRSDGRNIRNNARSRSWRAGILPTLTGLYDLLECAEQVTGKAGDRQVDHARLALSTCEGSNFNLALAHIIERAER